MPGSITKSCNHQSKRQKRQLLSNMPTATWTFFLLAQPPSHKEGGEGGWKGGERRRRGKENKSLGIQNDISDPPKCFHNQHIDRVPAGVKIINFSKLTDGAPYQEMGKGANSRNYFKIQNAAGREFPPPLVTRRLFLRQFSVLERLCSTLVRNLKPVQTVKVFKIKAYMWGLWAIYTIPRRYSKGVKWKTDGRCAIKRSLTNHFLSSR